MTAGRAATLPNLESGMPKLLLIAAVLGMFVAGASGTTRAPFLIDMARDLASSVPIIANLLAVNSIAWGSAAFLAGPDATYLTGQNITLDSGLTITF